MMQPRTTILGYFFLTAMWLHCAIGLPPNVRIGAIFTEDQRGKTSELVFKYAVHRINKDRTLLPNTTLVYEILYVSKDDSFHASKKICKLIETGVTAIFGSSHAIIGNHIQSICCALDIPHIVTRMDYGLPSKDLTINLHPHNELIIEAFRDVIVYLNWTKMAIIYEDDCAMIKLQHLLVSPPQRNMEIYIRQADASNYREILRLIRRKEFRNVIVDIRSQDMHIFLRSILQLQMNDYNHHYLFTSFDIETFDLEDFKYNFVNMTAFRIVDGEHPLVRQILWDIEKFQPKGQYILNKTNIVEAQPALMYDSVYVYARGLQSLERSTTLRLPNVSCNEEVPWVDGSSLYNYINSVEFRGLTGKIHFTEGRRSHVKLDLVKLKETSVTKVGEWKEGSGITITDQSAFSDNTLPNVTLIVTTIEEIPYVMVKKNGNLTGNDRFEGFCIDLLRSLSSMIGFNYVIELVPDRKYGARDQETGEWNGLVKQLLDKKADLAVASLTINYARESVIDFSKPFLNLGIGILIKVPTGQPTRLFSFLNPLAIEIWCYLFAAYILVSFTMFVMARFSPYEWDDPHPCLGNVDVVENQFSLSNSFWFVTGTLLRQGSGLNPKAASTRIVGGIWWFFTLIIISSYTANLAAFLTVERMITPIENVDELSEQSEIAYGTLEGGSTMTFFRDSKMEIYQKMWRYMEKKTPSVFVSTYEEGIQRVLKGNYAFLMESTMIDYFVQRDCNLTQVGGRLDSKGYGIATPRGSPWRDKISLAILELQEKGSVQILYNNWWQNVGMTCRREEKSKESKANALGTGNIGGVFVVLLCGLAVAIAVAVLEFCWNSKRNAQTDRTWIFCSTQQSLCSEMAEELRFAVRCRGSRQRPALRRQCSRCLQGSSYVPATVNSSQENGLRHVVDMDRASVHLNCDDS